jgi:hypothetical protein
MPIVADCDRNWDSLSHSVLGRLILSLRKCGPTSTLSRSRAMPSPRSKHKARSRVRQYIPEAEALTIRGGRRPPPMGLLNGRAVVQYSQERFTTKGFAQEGVGSMGDSP